MLPLTKVITSGKTLVLMMTNNSYVGYHSNKLSKVMLVLVSHMFTQTKNAAIPASSNRTQFARIELQLDINGKLFIKTENLKFPFLPWLGPE